MLLYGLPERAVADSPLRSKKVTSITSADTEKYLQGLCIDLLQLPAHLTLAEPARLS